MSGDICLKTCVNREKEASKWKWAAAEVKFQGNCKRGLNRFCEKFWWWWPFSDFSTQNKKNMSLHLNENPLLNMSFPGRRIKRSFNTLYSHWDSYWYIHIIKKRGNTESVWVSMVLKKHNQIILSSHLIMRKWKLSYRSDINQGCSHSF